MELNNSTVLITGGSSGIGFEMAKRLIQKKNNVAREIKKILFIWLNAL